MNRWLEILLGVVIIAVIFAFTWSSPAWGSFWNFRHAAWEFLKGGFVWGILMIGILLVIVGISDFKS